MSAYRNYVFLEMFKARNVLLTRITYTMDCGLYEDGTFVHIMYKESYRTSQTGGILHREVVAVVRIV